MKNNQKITSMHSLRKEKRRLEMQIVSEKAELIVEVEKYKDSLWPFCVMTNFRKTIDSLSESKLVILGAQLAYSALNTAKQSKERKENETAEKETSSMKSTVVEFLKKTAKNFLENYVKKGEEE